MRHPGGRKLLAQIFRGRKFFAAELRVPMEVTPELREFGVNLRQLFLDPPQGRVGRRAGWK